MGVVSALLAPGEVRIHDRRHPSLASRWHARRPLAEFSRQENGTARDIRDVPMVSSDQGVLVRLFRTVVLVVMAALVSNAQCYGNCATAEYSPVQTAPSDGCHHHHDNNPPSKDGFCPHDHLSFAGPESRPTVVKVSPPSTPFAFDLSSLSDTVTYAAGLIPLSSHSGSPPTQPERTCISILRI